MSEKRKVPDPYRPVTEYGCTRCQKQHREGLDPEYHEHLMCQSKHGITTRKPTTGEMFRRLVEDC